MAILAAIGGGAFVLASLAVGLRLLAMAARTRQLPEAAMGAALLLTGGVGYPINVVARSALELSEGTRGALFAGHLATQLLGMGALAGFNWRVFRPASGLAAGFAAAIVSTLVLGLVAQGVGPGYVAALGDPAAPWPTLGALVAIVTLGWAGGESWRYHGLLRRRRALGLADPVLTDRFRLWAIGSSSAAVLTACSVVANLLGVDFAVWPPGALLIAALGLVSAGCVALAFVPPAAYRRRVEAAARA